MTDIPKTLKLFEFRSEVKRVTALMNTKGLSGFCITTPFSRGYRRIKSESPDDLENTIVDATIFLIKEQELDKSFQKVNIENKDGNPVFELTLFPSMVELKDLRKNDEASRKYKILLETS